MVKSRTRTLPFYLDKRETLPAPEMGVIPYEESKLDAIHSTVKLLLEHTTRLVTQKERVVELYTKEVMGRSDDVAAQKASVEMLQALYETSRNQMIEKLRSLETEIERLRGQLNKARSDIEGQNQSVTDSRSAFLEIRDAARSLFFASGHDQVMRWEDLRAMVGEA